MIKVSVIIPLYNAEKYLGDCLASLLAQTLPSFEVIVVDDGSIDNSPEVAASYLERFGGRLKIISLPRNTGSGAIPRNEGLKFSRGEYIFFMDADDLLAVNALERLYCAAKNFRADVVYMNRGFVCSEDSNPVNTKLADWDKASSKIETPTLETTDLVKRMKKMFATNYGWAPWIKFLRRDFLLSNDINFPKLRISEDVIWTMELVFLAERWLYFPERLYTYRTSNNSMMRSRRSPEEEIKFWLDPLIKGVDYLDEFMDGLEFFSQNPSYRFDVTNFFVKMQIAGMLNALKKLNHHELYEIIHREFSNGKHAALIANLFVFTNFYRDKLLEERQR